MKNIIVLGSGRSGTSLLAGLMAGSDYFIGTDYIRPRSANPKGFFEGREINLINERLIAQVLPTESRITRFLRGGNRVPRQGQRWLARIPPSVKIPGDRDLEAEIQELVRQVPYCFKDPRFSYTLPVWRRYLENEIYLCVYRDPAETAKSILKECREAPYLQGLKIDSGLCFDVWFLMYSRIVEEHRKTGDWMFLHYHQLFDRAKLEQLQRFSGAPISYDFPDRKLHRSKSEDPIPDRVAALYRQLNEIAGYTPA